MITRALRGMLLCGLAAFLSAWFFSPATAQPVVFTTDSFISASDSSFEGRDIIVRGCAVTIDGQHTFSSLAIERGPSNQPGVVTHTAAYSGSGVNGLSLIITGDMTIQGADGSLVASRLDVAGGGSPSATGRGAGSNGSNYGGGAGHGGVGGSSSQVAGGVSYGSLLQPSTLGSGGGKGSSSVGGAGGGCVRLQVSGILTVEGIITADGKLGGTTGGGGSGGSVWLTVGELRGSGTISANGATVSSPAGSGAGGRIALYYNTGSFTGTVSAKSGAGRAGGAGTIYTRVLAAGYGTVLVDNGGQPAELTPLATPEAFNLVVTGSAVVSGEAPLIVQNLSITNGGVLTHLPGQTSLDVTVQGSGHIGPSCAIDVAGKGFTSGLGPGAGPFGPNYGGGAGHGGVGGASGQVAGGVAYGSILQPSTLGSGGGKGGSSAGGAGGGCVRLQVSGILTVDGTITADGKPGGATGGGGSGGSIWITAGELRGSGIISANGGTVSSPAGSGAGGRIAIYYGGSTFSGQITAYGGANRAGGPGTVYTKSSLQQVGNLRIDNGGRTGSLTALRFAMRYNLILAGGATAYPVEPVTLASLRVESGATLIHLPEQTGLDVTVQGDALIASGGAISVSEKGFPSAQGPGAGRSGANYGAGGGYGGAGGSSAQVPGGPAYGSRERPVDCGSGGGKGGSGAGGPGGGAIRLRVNGALTLDGSLLADGGVGSPTGGAGSGGSIHLTVGSLFGTGMITAAGGTPASAATGGGAGGRVAIYYGDMSGFSVSQISVAGGGAGARKGEDGTIYLSQVEPPQIAEIPNHFAIAGQAYRGPVPVIANDAAGVQWELVAGPVGMTIDRDTGEVFWASPTSAGSPYTVTIQASNAGGSGSETWKLTVIQHAKLAPDGIRLHFGGQVVTAAFPDVFYIEKDDRSSGIRVEMAGHELTAGQRADVEGLTATNADGERFIQASRALQSSHPNGTGVIQPLSMANRSVGGGDLFYDPADGSGQKGITGGTGVNNIGLLVRTWGVVTAVDPSSEPAWFTIDDGSGRNIRCVAVGGSLAINAGWQGSLLAVTGISSVKDAGSGPVSVILLSPETPPAVL
ncbi:MAG: putative Ig domain-containing protein [Armatimonadota bacterium]